MSKKRSARTKKTEKYKKWAKKNHKNFNKNTSSSYSKSTGLFSSKKKLSESIWKFGKPLIERAESSTQERYAIEVSILLWNVSLLSSSKDDGLEKVLKLIHESKDIPESIGLSLIESFGLLSDRKEKYFAHDKRMVLSYSLDKTEDGFYLQVVSDS